ncbi:MAG: AMP-binding protein, partial [Candidatus Aminicenantes bacterium]|nr:AMP-binding protein [Candidatus Aminicenantes bacterium]
MSERTLPALFEESVRAFPENVLIWEKTAGRYEPTTYAGLQPLVHRFAAGLMSLGLAKGDRAALISEGRKAWLISELGILFTGAVNVPISVRVDELGDLKFRLAHSGCRMAVVSRSQLPKIRQIRRDLPDLVRVILLDETDALGPDEIPAAEVLRLGEEFLKTRRPDFNAAAAAVRESDPAN